MRRKREGREKTERNKGRKQTMQQGSKEAHQHTTPQKVLDCIEVQKTMKQEISMQDPKENQEMGLREQADKQTYANTSGKTTVYTDYQERPLGRKGRNVDSTILRYVGDS